VVTFAFVMPASGSDSGRRKLVLAQQLEPEKGNGRLAQRIFDPAGEGYVF